MVKTVLLIDDDTEFLYELCEMLKNCGYTVKASPTGCDVCQLALKTRPNIILLDLKMPAKSGFEIARELKENDKLNSIPILAITGAYLGNVDKRLIELCGMAGYLLKPFTPLDIISRIESYAH